MDTLLRRSFAARNAVVTLGDAIAAVSAVAAAAPVPPRADEHSAAGEE